MVLGSDMHSFWVTELRPERADAAASPVASEFVTTSLSAAGPPPGRFEPLLAPNPHVRFLGATKRGYALATVTPELWRTDFRVVGEVRNPKTGGGTLASFVVEAGRPGPMRG